MILEKSEYMFLPVNIVTPTIIHHYQLNDIQNNDRIYIIINKGMYGLPQEGKISHNHLSTLLTNKKIITSPFTPGLWSHKMRHIHFVLWVDDFGIQYMDKYDLQYLLQLLQKHYIISTYSSGQNFCVLNYNGHTAHLIVKS